MTRSRLVATVAAAFVLSEILATLVHGFVLAADYQPFEGTLLRPGPVWQMILLPVAHLSFIVGLVWVAARLRLEGSTLARGACLGVLGWTMGQVPLWLIWYAEQPWPGVLVVKQLLLELASSLIVGLTIAAIARPQGRRPAGTVAVA